MWEKTLLTSHHHQLLTKIPPTTGLYLCKYTPSCRYSITGAIKYMWIEPSQKARIELQMFHKYVNDIGQHPTPKNYKEVDTHSQSLHMWKQVSKHWDKMNNTTIDTPTGMDKEVWGEKLLMALMIGGPLYLEIIVIMLVYSIRRRHQTADQGHQNWGYRSTLDSRVIHYWIIPYGDSEDSQYVH